MICRLISSAAFAAIASAGAAHAQAYPDKLLWGDTHLHTNLSVDAYFLQNRTVDADTSYRFAKGEPVIHPYSRARMQLQTPLDFLAVSDHAELLGTPYALFTQGDKGLAGTRLGKRLIELQQAGNDEDAFGLFILAITLANTPAEQRPKKVGLGTALLWRWQDLTSAPDQRARATRWLLCERGIAPLVLGEKSRRGDETQPSGQVHHLRRLGVHADAGRREPAPHRHHRQRAGESEGVPSLFRQ
jgi:hypothetical protein